jgi:hypothetical protein
MMRLIHYVLADQKYRTSTPFPPFPKEQWGEPPIIPPGFGIGITSVLYSDVGTNFYTDCGIGLSTGTGWIIDGPINTIWQVPEPETEPEPVPVTSQTDEACLEKTASLGFNWLTEERKSQLWDLDAEVIRREINSADTPCISFLPNNGVAQFPQDLAAIFLPASITEPIWGAETTTTIANDTDMDVGVASFITWKLDYGKEGPNTLVVSRLRADNKTFPVLLQAAFHAARKLGLEQVEIWNFDPNLAEMQTPNAQGVRAGVTSETDDNLPSLAWYGEGNVQWRYNEQFCWL